MRWIGQLAVAVNKTTNKRDEASGACGRHHLPGSAAAAPQRPAGSMSSARASLALSALALFLALGGGAVALQGKNSVNSGDIKNGAVKGEDVKSDTLLSSDIDNGTLRGVDVEDDSIGGDQIDETSLQGLDLGDTDVELTGGQADLFETVTLAETPAGAVELACAPAPALEFTNDTGSDVVVIQASRGIVFEDDGVAGNGEMAMSRAELASGDTHAVNLAGVGNIGSGEVAVVADEVFVLALARVFAGLDGCEYLGRVEHTSATAG